MQLLKNQIMFMPSVRKQPAHHNEDSASLSHQKRLGLFLAGKQLLIAIAALEKPQPGSGRQGLIGLFDTLFAIAAFQTT